MLLQIDKCFLLYKVFINSNLQNELDFIITKSLVQSMNGEIDIIKAYNCYIMPNKYTFGII